MEKNNWILDDFHGLWPLHIFSNYFLFLLIGFLGSHTRIHFRIVSVLLCTWDHSRTCPKALRNLDWRFRSKWKWFIMWLKVHFERTHLFSCLSESSIYLEIVEFGFELFFWFISVNNILWPSPSWCINVFTCVQNRSWEQTEGSKVSEIQVIHIMKIKPTESKQLIKISK